MERGNANTEELFVLGVTAAKMFLDMADKDLAGSYGTAGPCGIEHDLTMASHHIEWATEDADTEERRRHVRQLADRRDQLAIAATGHWHAR